MSGPAIFSDPRFRKSFQEIKQEVDKYTVLNIANQIDKYFPGKKWSDAFSLTCQSAMLALMVLKEHEPKNLSASRTIRKLGNFLEKFENEHGYDKEISLEKKQLLLDKLKECFI